MEKANAKMRIVSLCLASVVMLLSAGQAARADADGVGKLIIGIIGGVVGNALKQNIAKDSWARVDVTMKQCFEHRHRLDVQSLIRNGISADDNRLRPAYVDCAQFLEAERIRIEAERRRVVDAQNLLTELGYDPGPPDGLWGSKTAAALHQFQRDRGLPTTGQINDGSLRQLQNEMRRLREQDSRIAGQRRQLLPQTADDALAVERDGPASLREEERPDGIEIVAPRRITPTIAENTANTRRKQVVEMHGEEFADQILNGEIVVGMNIEQVIAARGEPSRKDLIPPDDELWYYGVGSVSFYKGEVAYVSK